VKRSTPPSQRQAAKRRPDSTRRRAAGPAKAARWSQRVTQTSNALDLEGGVFAQEDPRQIALSLKRSAERSERRKAEPYRSAMSMLCFYINRAGKNLSAERRAILERAKEELRRLFRST
jgi:hypothetical protein